MKYFKFYLLLILLFLGLVPKGFAQEAYDVNLALGRKFYQSKEYVKAAKCYSKAFSSNHNLGLVNHRYEAASCWALGGEIDSAFYQLDKILPKYYYQFSKFSNDSSFQVLWSDPRWTHLLKLVEKENVNSEQNIHPKITTDYILLAAKLDTILNDDQTDRKKIDSIKKTFGLNSVEMATLNKRISSQDSINLEKVKLILDKNGWLGKDEIGDKGSHTLFLVIQHSDLNTQLKYIPLLRDAVNRGKAQPSSLALMEDRITIRQGRKQIYGSQLNLNARTGKYYVAPLEDPGRVDIRRAKVGLRPISTYVSKWGITWSLEQYIKDLASASQE